MPLLNWGAERLDALSELIVVTTQRGSACVADTVITRYSVLGTTPRHWTRCDKTRRYWRVD